MSFVAPFALIFVEGEWADFVITVTTIVGVCFML